MKYKLEININLPRQQVIELFDNPENMKHWQPGFRKMEVISGTPGQEGTKSLIRYHLNGRDIEMFEVITKRNLPDEFHGIYEAGNVWNEVKNYFTELDENTTKWIAANDFKLQGWQKIFSLFLSEAFKKQSYDSMECFKAFAEQKK